MPGPKKTPTKVLQLTGSWRAKARAKTEVKPAGIALRPRGLSPKVRAVWDELAPKLASLGLLRDIDVRALERYCVAWVRWRKAIDFIEKHGEVYPIKDEKGAIRCFMQFPQSVIAGKVSRELSTLERCFGMTPADRAGLDGILPILDTPESRRIDELLFGKRPIL